MPPVSSTTSAIAEQRQRSSSLISEKIRNSKMPNIAKPSRDARGMKAISPAFDQ